MRIYFAHPISTYNTPQEKDWIKIIKNNLSEVYTIQNPNGEVHEDAYKQIGMIYFTEMAKSCDIGVFLPFNGGHFGMGVYREILAMADQGKDLYSISKEGIMHELDFKDITPLSINDTRKFVRNERKA